MRAKKNILVVEDDPVIGETLADDLRKEGFLAKRSSTLGEARQSIRDSEPDLLVLDLNLPDGHGLSLVRGLKDDQVHIPVVVLTAQTDEETAVKSLELGATDFLRKPFGRKELLLRVRKLLKLGVGTLRAGELELKPEQRRARVGKTDLTLTKTEFNILQKLMERFGDPVSRDELISVVDSDQELDERSLNTHISRLRKKLETAGLKGLKLASLYGQGYRLENK